MTKYSHEYFIQRCFELARRASKKVASNPKVGSVIVHNDTIIGEGWHEYAGGPHAEVNAVNSVKESDKHLLQASTIYVSLEPCNHHGKTPPCCDLIIKNKIPKVVISAEDPNPLMQGKSIKKLKDAGIDVISGLLSAEGKTLIRDFRVINLKKRPYIILKQVQSSDNYISKNGEQTWLSNEFSSILSHKWRSEIDAIVVGINTVIVDNPSLTTRHYEGESPLRIIIDPNNRTPIDAKVIIDNHPTLFLSNNNKKEGNKEWIKANDDSPIIEQISKLCYERGLYRIMIEGGANTIKNFVKENLWDEARVIRTPHELKSGVKSINIQGHLMKKEILKKDEILYISNISNRDMI